MWSPLQFIHPKGTKSLHFCFCADVSEIHCDGPAWVCAKNVLSNTEELCAKPEVPVLIYALQSFDYARNTLTTSF